MSHPTLMDRLLQLVRQHGTSPDWVRSEVNRLFHDSYAFEQVYVRIEATSGMTYDFLLAPGNPQEHKVDGRSYFVRKAKNIAIDDTYEHDPLCEESSPMVGFNPEQGKLLACWTDPESHQQQSHRIGKVANVYSTPF